MSVSMDERFKDKLVPKRDFENQELIRPEQGSFPTITEEQLENFLDTDTGRETFFEFAGFVDNEFRPVLYYLHHTDYPELGEKLRNLCFYLRGLKGKEDISQNHSPLEFYKYGFYLVLNRGLKSMASEIGEIPSESADLHNDKKQDTSNNITMPQFWISENLDLKGR